MRREALLNMIYSTLGISKGRNSFTLYWEKKKKKTLRSVGENDNNTLFVFAWNKNWPLGSRCRRPTTCNCSGQYTECHRLGRKHLQSTAKTYREQLSLTLFQKNFILKWYFVFKIRPKIQRLSLAGMVDKVNKTSDNFSTKTYKMSHYSRRVCNDTSFIWFRWAV